MKTLIVDDHPIVRAGLRRLLAAEPEVEICEAAEAREALTAFRRERPDLVVLDLNLGEVGGIELIGLLKAAAPDARILILSMHDDVIHVVRALQAGAAGYVSKQASPEEIFTAIKRVASGGTYVEHGIAAELAFSGVRAAPHPLQSLSAREFAILRLLAEGRTLPQIADAAGISYKTAANASTRIKAKLGAAGTADLIRIAIRAGLLDRDADLSA